MPAPRPLQTPRRQRSAEAANRILYPLDALCGRAGVVLPTVKPTTAGRIPSPYRELLVHENEMTSTLERHFGGAVTVRVLSSFSSGRSYFRRVVLALERTGRPVALGAVRLRLDAFSLRVRARILGEKVPLGRILTNAGVEYGSHPTAFFEVVPSAEMMAMFWMSRARTMYGRRTQLTVGADRAGDIVEIIPLV